MTSASTATRAPAVTFPSDWPVIRGVVSVLLLLFVPIFVDATPVGRVTARAAGPGWALEHHATLSADAYRGALDSETGNAPRGVERAYFRLSSANSAGDDTSSLGLLLFAGVFLAGMRRHGAMIGGAVSAVYLAEALQVPAEITRRYAVADWPGSFRLELTEGVAILIGAYVGLLLWHVVRYFLDRRAAQVSEARS